MILYLNANEKPLRKLLSHTQANSFWLNECLPKVPINIVQEKHGSINNVSNLDFMMLDVNKDNGNHQTHSHEYKKLIQMKRVK